MIDGQIGSAGAIAGGILQGITSVANTALSAANYAQQQKNYKWEQGMQMLMLAREDNAVQRRVNDLTAAGLSPVLAAGSAANAGPVVQTHTPQMSQIPDMSEIAKVTYNLLTQEKQISQTEAQTQLIRKQQDKINSDIEVNNYNKLRMASEIALNASKKAATDTNNRITRVDARNAELSGIGKDSSSYGKMAKDLDAYVKSLYDTFTDVHKQARKVKEAQQPSTTPGGGGRGKSSGW